MASFWTNVKKLLPYKNLEVKDLAFRAGVPYSTIINGMNKNSMPHADLALKISKIMNISLESLLGEETVRILNAETEAPSQSELEKQELTLYRKNKLIIDALEEIPVTVRDSMQDLILKTRDSY
ncbi:MAG: helix-turn-helix transcriptional regulator [Treponema sp.]|nr:helix-turn-helix transcriptional regulator [Treponema sp.]